jgi:hypothetical protein
MKYPLQRINYENKSGYNNDQLSDFKIAKETYFGK